MNKLIYSGLSILDVSKTVMREFWDDYVKPKYGESAKVCFHFLIAYVKADDMLQKPMKQGFTLQILN